MIAGEGSIVFQIDIPSGAQSSSRTFWWWRGNDHDSLRNTSGCSMIAPLKELGSAVSLVVFVVVPRERGWEI